MEAELRFKIPEEQQEFAMAARGHKYWSALDEIRIAIRNHNKHGASKADTIAAVQAVLDEVSFFMEEL
jgi:hypothetical protein